MPSWLILLFLVLQFGILITGAIRGLRMQTKLQVLEKEVRTRNAQIDELSNEHHEIRMLFAGIAHKDIHKAQTDYFNGSSQ